jgi:hypothetical protein
VSEGDKQMKTHGGIEFSKETPEGSRKETNQENFTLGQKGEEEEDEAEKEMVDSAGKKRKGGTRDEIQTMAPTYKIGGKSLVLLQVICRSI